ncbi:unnamed protein product, partial [Porites lobata]
IRDVVVSEVPIEDLEKSPAPILPYNHIPHRSAICQACSTDLPDYFIAISNVSEVSPQLSEGFWTEDIDTSDDENGPPPCYEQALRMSKYFTKDDCSQSNIALVGKICGGVFILFFVVSGAAVIACNKRHRPESNSIDVVVSEIPMEDLEKSPAPILPYNHIPHRPVCAEACSTDLPDYFIAISNVPNVSPHLRLRGFWTEDIDNSDDENDPPPCYEQALIMYGLISIESAELED